MKELKFTISGMHCGSCEKIIQMKLEDIKGVLESDISSETSSGLVKTEDNVSSETIIEAIKKAGYKAELKEN
ncbi:MAG: copper chaperone [Berkelbacteria bacterium GW2011_GWB1_38_5]|uniref:Copper chaperone n=1 Tax=Berkelbacteria bacterium GW2011_GWB1_38_5 TaxID=1618336 RepID=A0A0G0NB41_9BACT|nr:MAG: copper chaperone [Berkelbacteria bacterium GW2011_GWB1_38_5]